MKVVKTRTSHMCSYCGRDIEKGEKAKTEATKHGRVSGNGWYWETDYYHLNCPVEERY